LQHKCVRLEESGSATVPAHVSGLVSLEATLFITCPSNKKNRKLKDNGLHKASGS